jgi:hypothetical protein
MTHMQKALLAVIPAERKREPESSLLWRQRLASPAKSI